jgi:hypothetical protein
MDISSAGVTNADRPSSTSEASVEKPEAELMAVNNKVAESSGTEGKDPQDPNSDKESKSSDMLQMRTPGTLDDGRGKLVDVSV